MAPFPARCVDARGKGIAPMTQVYVGDRRCELSLEQGRDRRQRPMEKVSGTNGTCLGPSSPRKRGSRDFHPA